MPSNSDGMSIYATLNSRRTIRENTVRLQTFGQQVENYDAPPPQTVVQYGRTSRFIPSISHEELGLQHEGI